jgi:thiamine pyrophosphate-dependent acetolactate synthase large subunit-like protein
MAAVSRHSAKVSTAEAVIRRLEAHGVRHVFGIPGTHNLPLYRYLAGSAIEHVTPRHEQGAGYAADGYARAGGRPGVCLTTTGPGLLNIATAAATAYADSIPMLVISPGMSRSVAGRDVGYLHELRDQTGVMERLVARSVRVEGPAAAAEAIDMAFDSFAAGRPRPVHVEIPIDALREEDATPGPPPSPATPAGPDPGLVRAAADRLASARSAALVLGGGVAAATGEARALAARLGLPVITTVNGKGVVSERDPLSLGASIRLRSCQRFLRERDLVLAVGTELAQSDLWRDAPLELDGDLIRIDIDPDELDRNAKPTLAIAGDAALTLSAILAELGDGDPPADAATPVAAARETFEAEVLGDGAAYAPLCRALAEALPPGAIVAGDSTRPCYYGVVHLLAQDEPRRFIYPTGFATLGYGLPAAVGAKLAAPEHAVVVLIGDGGFMFTAAELAVAAELGLPIPIVVANDAGYGEIRREMAEQGQEPIGVELPPPDFAALAVALGAGGRRVADAGELAELLPAALEADGPTVFELPL